MGRDVSQNFNHAWELMCLATEGMICLVAMQVLSMDNCKATPQDAPNCDSTDETRQTFLNNCCEKVVDFLWHKNDVKAVLGDEGGTDGDGGYPFCHCEEERGEDIAMVGCGAENSCFHKEWYHVVSTHFRTHFSSHHTLYITLQLYNSMLLGF